MKRSMLARLRSNGFYYLAGALFILVVAPLYQIIVLGPTGFGAALNGTGSGRYAAYLAWISAHSLNFIMYRAILIIAFALLISFPFSLYRIIVAQEIMGQQELAEQEDEVDTEPSELDETDQDMKDTQPEVIDEETDKEIGSDGMPAYAWRGKGFAVLAAWLSLIGICIYVLSAVASTFFFISVANPYATGTDPTAVTNFSTIFTISTNTAGTGLLGLGVLFFGAMIVRTGRHLWPGIWVNFGYVALFIAALLCISAIGVVSAPGAGQGTLTTLATLLFAIWILWLGTMLVRLKPEA
ncbi:MAG: hypothetical protein NVS2B12_12130 [Ktedonobacteraceae bacterium]